jgi:hypothetical protein
MEAHCASETLVSTYKSTRRYNTEDKHRKLYRRENLESQTKQILNYTTRRKKTVGIRRHCRPIIQEPVGLDCLRVGLLRWNCAESVSTTVTIVIIIIVVIKVIIETVAISSSHFRNFSPFISIPK